MIEEDDDEFKSREYYRITNQLKKKNIISYQKIIKQNVIFSN